ncbi:MAG TPA: molybdopterin guanine dinucleotide synthesis [Paracoccaceae bacterium]|nr:molybdopterin guanine dinucleotide synthesis [Paracoccaceae bacterium]
MRKSGAAPGSDPQLGGRSPGAPRGYPRGRAALFDLHVMVDWSARSHPSPARECADAIWIGQARPDGPGETGYLRSRHAAVDYLADIAGAGAGARDQRVLIGFDFPFGYPQGFAERVTGRAEALALWGWLAQAIEDGPDNANNRFEVAEGLNAICGGTGPFWGRPEGASLPGLPARASARSGRGGLAERRIVEGRVRRAQPVWKLYTVGSVGSQALLGIPAVARLARAVPGAAIWPFETGLGPSGARVVLAELYPGLIEAEVRRAQRATGDPIKDRVQVRLVAGALARLDAAGRLGELFGGAPDLTAAEREIVAREEAWILGAGFEAILREAAGASAAPPGWEGRAA